MPVPSGSRLQAEYRAARSRTCPAEQIVNAADAMFDLSPVSQAPAVATRAKWAVLLPGQTVPLIWERVEPDWYCEPV